MPLFGSGAFAYALPAGSRNPLVFDEAFAAEPWNKLRIAHLAGRGLKLGSGCDAEGQPTQDFRNLHHLLPGNITQLGLALLTDVLTGLLPGQPPAQARQLWEAGHWVVAINPRPLWDEPTMPKIVEGYLETLRRAIEGTTARLPGDESNRRLDEAWQSGIPLQPYHIQSLQRLKQLTGTRMPTLPFLT
jgi:LDH2 family malate/lactate/ureidoglycolate dehydrogenase